MKRFSDVVANGFALAVAMIILAMALELKQDVKAQSPERQPQHQGINPSQQERKDIKTERRERRKERRERRKEQRNAKPENKIIS